MKPNNTDHYHLAIILAAILYGLIGVFVRLIGTGVPPMTMSFFRLFFGFLFAALAILLLKRRKRSVKDALHLRKGDLRHFIAVGIIMAVTLSVYTIAFLYAPIENVALLVNSFVLFTAVFAYFFLQERLTAKEGLLLLCGLFGIWLMNPLKPASMTGNILALVAGITYAMLLTYLRYEERGHTISAMFWFLLFATLVMLPFPFVYGWGNVAGNLLWLVLLGVLPTGLAYLLLAYGLEKTPAETASISIMLFTPLSSIFLGWLVFGETIHASIILGGVILLTAGVLLEVEKTRRKKGKR